MPRLEDLRLVRGGGRFTDDVHLEGEAVAAFVRSPHPSARILAIRDDQARQLPGVLAVLTARDYLADGHVGISHQPVPADAIAYQRPAFAGQSQAHLPLALDAVTFTGEAVAVVVAETAAIARDAADLVEVDYDVQPAVADLQDALQPDAPQVLHGIPGNLAAEGAFGDREATEAALRQAEHLVERAFTIQRIVNAQMEPRSAIGSYDPDAQTYLMIAGSQGVVRQWQGLAQALQTTPDKVQVICPDVGGGFGPRSNLYPEQVVVCWAARRVGRPVRWTSTRSEAFLTDYQGRDAVATARLGLDGTGRIQALAVDFALNVGGRTMSYVPLSNAARIATGVYDVPTAWVRVRGVLTHTVPTGPYRGAGRPEAIFILERLLDLAAHQVGMDRVELRRRNLVRTEHLPYVSAMGLTYDSGDFPSNMATALRLADWSGFPVRRDAARRRGRLAGIGLANYVEAPVGAPTERVLLRVLPERVVQVTVGTQSTGQGHATSFAQVVADELGVRPDQVQLITGDTAVVVAGGGTHSDRSMRLAGTLLVEACGKIRSRIREIAGEDSGLTPFEVAQEAELVAEATFTGRIPAHPTGCAICEVEVDPETGRLEIVRYTCVDDVGRPINPLILHGQVHGGIAQGLGQAVCEGVVYDASGQVLTGSFLDYALPTAALVPEIDAVLAEHPTRGNPLGVKGGGESGITPAMACVANAVVDALADSGVQHVELPLSAARVWAALQPAGFTGT